MHGSGDPGLGLAGPAQNGVQLLGQNNSAGLSREGPALWKEVEHPGHVFSCTGFLVASEPEQDRAANECKS